MLHCDDCPQRWLHNCLSILHMCGWVSVCNVNFWNFTKYFTSNVQSTGCQNRCRWYFCAYHKTTRPMKKKLLTDKKKIKPLPLASCQSDVFNHRVWLTHWGWVTHICIGQLTIIGSDNGLSPGRRQAIIWTNDGILLIGPSGTNFSEILIGIQTFSFKKMHLKITSAKWRPFCLCLNVFSAINTV